LTASEYKEQAFTVNVRLDVLNFIEIDGDATVDHEEVMRGEFGVADIPGFSRQDFGPVSESDAGIIALDFEEEDIGGPCQAALG
jgi:hypothetical protein